MKKNIIAVLIGVVIWYFLASFLLTLIFRISNKDFRHSVSFLLFYGAVISFVAAFIAGRLGKAKGLFLALVTQSVITASFILLFQRGLSISALFKGFSIYILWLFFSGTGGVIGEKTREKIIESRSEIIMNRDRLAILCGLFIWIIFAFLLKDVNEFIFEHFINYYPYISLWTLLLILSFAAALCVGYLGKSRGWTLGLTLQAIVTLILVMFFLFSSTAHEDIKERNVNFLVAFLYFVLKQLPWLMAAAIGGYVGAKFRRKTKLAGETS